MTRRSLLQALMLSGLAAAFGISKADPAAAAKKSQKAAKAAVKKCHGDFNDCIGGCPSVGGSQAYDPNNECHVDCGFKEYNCLTANQSSGQQGQDGGSAPQPGGVISQPKDKGLRNRVNRDQTVDGSSSQPKRQLGLSQVSVDSLSSGPKSEKTATIQRSSGGKKH